MKILITGAAGFIGKNLVWELKNQKHNDIFEFNRDTDLQMLDIYTKECDMVFHLAGENRPKNDTDFQIGNTEFTKQLILFLKKNRNKAPILMTSSVQAEVCNNIYGKSKKEAENSLFLYGKEMDVRILVYRLPNVFGKWCKPNYNSVIATFCNNIANNLDIQINNTDTVLKLAYIDDVINEFINALNGKENKQGQYGVIPVQYIRSLGEIAKIMYSFKNGRNIHGLPDMSDEFTKNLYSTYLSYLPPHEFKYSLNMNIDNRGSFTEFIRTDNQGQFSVNVLKPGIIKGNHWHHTKIEKFLVVSGMGLIQLRRVFGEEVINHPVTAENLEVVDIPPGYTHNIINKGVTDMVVIIWSNELFNPKKPDTYYLEV